MRVAIVGSRGLQPTDERIAAELPEGVTLIVSGGARGVDACAARFARARGIPLREFLPDYRRYGRRAPLLRNQQIVAAADLVLAFWDGHSMGTAHTIRIAQEAGKHVRIIL